MSASYWHIARSAECAGINCKRSRGEAAGWRRSLRLLCSGAPEYLLFPDLLCLLPDGNAVLLAKIKSATSYRFAAVKEKSRGFWH